MSCLSPNDLSSFVAGTLEPVRRPEIVEHLAECRDCRRRWSEQCLAAELAAGPTEAAPEILKARVKARARDAGRRTPVGRRSVVLALAAVLLMAVGLGWWVVREERAAPGHLLLRDAASAPTAPRLNSEVGVKGQTFGFSWSGVPNAQDYSLTITDENGDVVHTARVPHVDGAEIESHVDRAATDLVIGQSYVWFVTAHFADGTEVDSEILLFVVGDGG